MTSGSTAAQGSPARLVLPVSALQSPYTDAYRVLMKSAQINHTTAPVIKLAFAAVTSGFLEYIATAKAGRNAEAHNPMNIAVARAMILPGIRNAIITLAIIMISTPTWFALIDNAHWRPLPQRSHIRAVPIVWKRELSVDIAAASSVTMNSTTNQSGIAWLMKIGMIVSTLPPGATWTAIFETVW